MAEDDRRLYRLKTLGTKRFAGLFIHSLCEGSLFICEARAASDLRRTEGTRGVFVRRCARGERVDGVFYLPFSPMENVTTRDGARNRARNRADRTEDEIKLPEKGKGMERPQFPHLFPGVFDVLATALSHSLFASSAFVVVVVSFFFFRSSPKRSRGIHNSRGVRARPSLLHVLAPFYLFNSL